MNGLTRVLIVLTGGREIPFVCCLLLLSIFGVLCMRSVLFEINCPVCFDLRLFVL